MSRTVYFDAEASRGLPLLLSSNHEDDQGMSGGLISECLMHSNTIPASFPRTSYKLKPLLTFKRRIGRLGFIYRLCVSHIRPCYGSTMLSCMGKTLWGLKIISAFRSLTILVNGPPSSRLGYAQHIPNAYSTHTLRSALSSLSSTFTSRKAGEKTQPICTHQVKFLHHFIR